MEKLDYLINYLLKENKEIRVNQILQSIEDKKRIYRSLCNIRNAMPISKEYIKIENEYLQEELKNKKITDVKNIEAINNPNFENSDKICLWKGDITTLQIDAIVNAANSQGLGCFVPCHKCIDNQIHSCAGIGLRLECNDKMKKIDILETGKAFITKGYNLPAKFVIHTVGPIIYNEPTQKEKTELMNCYINSLKLAKQNNMRTIVFPCISTGEFRFPKEEAVKCAIKSIQMYLKENRESFDKIVFNLYSEEDLEIYEQYIKENYEN